MQSKQLRRMKILVTESSKEARQHLFNTLQAIPTFEAEEQYSLFVAKDGEEALELFAELHPDLLLIGTNLSGPIASYDVCQKVRNLEGEHHTGIVFVAKESDMNESQLAADVLSVKCLEIGADDFIQPNSSPEELKARVRAVLRLKRITDELRSANHRLKILSMTDELTGLANMRCFNQRLLEVWEKREQKLASDALILDKSQLAMIMLDLDHFKNINDSANHLMGSHVLSEVGKLIRTENIFSSEDIAARYGGDEFIIYGYAPFLESFVAKAEKLREVIAATTFTRDGFKKKITGSFGVAWAAPIFKGKAEDLIKAADYMLYRSKETGRNKVSSMILDQPIALEHLTDMPQLPSR